MISPRLGGSERRSLPACARGWAAESGRVPASRIGWSCLSCPPSCGPGPHSESGSSGRGARTSITAQSSTSNRSCLPEPRSLLAYSLITTFASGPASGAISSSLQEKTTLCACGQTRRIWTRWRTQPTTTALDALAHTADHYRSGRAGAHSRPLPLSSAPSAPLPRRSRRCGARSTRVDAADRFQ